MGTYIILRAEPHSNTNRQMPENATARASRHLAHVTAFKSHEIYGADLFRGTAKQHSVSYRGYMDSQQQLNFPSFCKLVREREPDVHSLHELRYRFSRIDRTADGRITIDECACLSHCSTLTVAHRLLRLIRLHCRCPPQSCRTRLRHLFLPHRYVTYVLRDSLKKAAQPLINMFRSWDIDGSGLISRLEFAEAIARMNFDFMPDDYQVSHQIVSHSSPRSTPLRPPTPPHPKLTSAPP